MLQMIKVMDMRKKIFSYLNYFELVKGEIFNILKLYSKANSRLVRV
jgi:hypothetical protein